MKFIFDKKLSQSKQQVLEYLTLNCFLDERQETMMFHNSLLNALNAVLDFALVFGARIDLFEVTYLMPELASYSFHLLYEFFGKHDTKMEILF